MSNDNESENTTPESADEVTNQSIDALKADLEKSKKDYMYLLADFDNYRKNTLKERSELLRFGAERFIRDLLNVVDNFERALETQLTPESIPKFREGIQMITVELKQLLTKHGVEEIESAGLPFDPSKHEALSSEPSKDFSPGSVSRVFKKAYKLHDKLLRPAQVVVAVEPPENGAGQS